MRIKSKRIGVIAEDETDCDTIRNLVDRIAPGQRLGITPRPSHGCHHLLRKAPAWMRELVTSGCSAAIIVRDCDRDPQTNALNDPATVLRALQDLPRPKELVALYCVPVQEIEAWFFSDDNVVKSVGRGRGNAHPSPHNIIDPKETLRRLSYDAGGKPRYSTNDNPMLAKQLDIEECAKRCPAFAELREFVLKLVA